MKYLVSSVKVGEVDRGIVLQQTHGTCPIVSICNALSLQGNLSLKPGSISSQELFLMLYPHACSLDPEARDVSFDMFRKDLETIENGLGKFTSIINLIFRGGCNVQES
jgi:hypothetical protein